MQQRHGSCHCKRVTFVVQADNNPECENCNCSVCKKSGYLHLIVPKTQFQLLTGKDKLKEYNFGTGVARHYFCQHCGIKPFYIPRSNPDGIDVNVNCLDEPLSNANIVDFDGQNWEKNAHKLSHKA